MDFEHAESHVGATLAVAAAVIIASVAILQLPTPNTVGIEHHPAMSGVVAPGSVLHFPR